jgi:hypothetical protein
MKYDIAQRVLKDLPDFAEKQQKFEADKSNSIAWKPTFSRIKIKPDPEQLSGLIDTAPGYGESLTRGVIVSIGPDVGKKDGRQVENFWVGQRVLYLAAHVMRYTGADNVTHHFLKENSDVTSIIAVEPADAEPVGTITKLENIQKNLDKTSDIAKSLNEKV